MSQIKAIYARAENGIMGAGNTLPWNVPSDLRRFKRLTSGCIVVMGANTWLSLGSKPLPNRKNVVVVSPDRPLPSPNQGAQIAFSLEDAINKQLGDSRTIWVIGGPGLIADAMDMFDAEVHRTTLGIKPKGDVRSTLPDLRLECEYRIVGNEGFICSESRVPVVMERYVKSGINAGLK